MTSNDHYDAVVIGGGPAGLAAAAELRRAGQQTVILERADSVGASWRARYDGLRLNTSRWLSRLPGVRYDRGTARFPSREQVVEYLERYAERQRLDVRTGIEAQRVDRCEKSWLVGSPSGDFVGRHVVIATGWDRVPHIPDWPGCEDFAGELIHAASYRNPEPYRGRDVLVVGPNCTGAEIATFLAHGGARRVRLAVRTPPNLVLRQWGIPADVLGVISHRQPYRFTDPQSRLMRRISIGDLSDYGLPLPPEGMFARFERSRIGPSVVDRDFVEAIRGGRVEVVASVTALDEHAVRLADGSVIEPDAVIAATGYRRGLESLVGHLGVLDAEGAPLLCGARAHHRAPDLYFVGFDPKIAGTLRQIRLEARRLGRSV